jgi:hypothetical protein
MRRREKLAFRAHVEFVVGIAVFLRAVLVGPE